MPFYRDFHAKVKFPADYSRALEQFIGLFSNLVIHQVNATVIGVAAGTNNLQVSLGIEGLWRWINAEVQATHPGGAAASYDIVATTTANVFTTGTEEEEDHTNYNWALQIVPTGTIPSGGGIAATRKIGTLKWSGTAITAIEQVVPPVPLHASRHAIGGSDPLTPALIGAATTAQASALEAAYEDIDANTNGIYRSADFQFAPTINSASAELVAPSISGKAKINGVRTNTNPPIALGLIPPSLPASGQFMSVLIQIAAGAGGFGTAGVLSLVSGVAKATEAEALAAAPALSEKNMRIKEIIIKNTGGVYSIVATRDRRPWARGYYVNQALLITKAKTTAFVTLAQQRIEATQNVNVRANIPAVSATAGDVLTVRLSIDGSVAANSIRNYAFNSVAPMVIDYEAVIASNGGTQLVALECAISAEGSGHEVLFAGTFAGEGVVQMQESAANGLSSNGTT